MAVATTNAFSGPFTANGSTTNFPFTFSVLSGADVTVALRDADGVETTVSANDYSVALTGDGPSAGSVTFDVAPATGNTVWLYLDPDFTQETEFVDGHPFLAGAVNNANDRAALRDQVLRRDVDRALLVPIGEAGIALPAAAERANKYLMFDADGAAQMDDPDNFAAPASAAATLSQAWAEGTLPGGAGTKSAKEHAGDSAASAATAEAARDVSIASSVQYPTAAAAVAGLADGAFGSYLDGDGNPVWGQRVGASMVALPGPWIDADKIGSEQPGTGAATRTVAAKLEEIQSAQDYSVPDGTGTNGSTALQNLIDAAVDAGSGFVHVNAGDILLNSSVDCKGLMLICAGTNFTGSGALWNNAGVVNATIAGVSQDTIYGEPKGIVRPSVSYKAFWKFATDNLGVVTPRARNGGYVLAQVICNVVTGTASVGGSAPLWRVTSVMNIGEAYIYKRATSATNGTVTEFNAAIGAGGNAYKCWLLDGSTGPGAWAEFTFTGTQLDIGFLKTAGSSQTVIVAIDGTTVETLDLRGTLAVTPRRYFTTAGGSHTVRVTNNTSTFSPTYVAGVNFSKPENWNGGTVDWLAYGRVTGAEYYIQGDGAQDYALNNGSLWAGSYHGGEVVSSAVFRADGVTVDVVSPGTNTMLAVAKSITLDQVSDFGWDATNRFDTRSLTEFVTDGGWGFSCAIEARPADGIDITDFYDSMTAAQVSFTAFDYPLLSTISGSDVYLPLGRTDYVRQRNPSTGQVIESLMSAPDIQSNKYGGAYVWSISPAYTKVYSGPCVGGKLRIKRRAFSSRKMFS